MTKNIPKITVLNPVVLPDNRRVMMEMVVENLPNAGAGSSCAVNFFDAPPVSPGTVQPDVPPAAGNGDAARTPSEYPDVELSILNGQRQEIASLLIVEHKEAVTSLTLHLRSVPNPADTYTARAHMTLNQQPIATVEVPFELNPQAN
ncbi:MAG: hypothetical protein D6768_07710 [Chloroflexi bacterium]|nr:MAG: hypothetical protein D6768_07710 [Chloroflexota bacterium]